MLSTSQQKEILSKYSPSFSSYLTNSLKPKPLEILQVNLGKKCNQACKHCHVDASPSRTEMMTKETMDACLDIIKSTNTIHTVDITGGAPEMHPLFKHFVESLHSLNKKIIDRCNLTILEEKGYEYLYDFLSTYKVEIVASLPHFSELTTDKQRGSGVFKKSITALQKLNKIGYGSKYPIHLVYNPVGVYLSSSQEELSKEFKSQLNTHFGIQFNNLYCINNMPISRFLEALIRQNKYESYMNTLVQAFNPNTIEHLMCRNQISISYDGNIYDCDFNQMLEIDINTNLNVHNFQLDTFLNRNISINNHCFGCTAGAGSSCGGELEN